MPSLNLKAKTLRYSAADLNALSNAEALLGAMADWDTAAKQDATSGLVALRHLREHVAKQRNGTPKAEKKAEAEKGR